MRKFSKLVCLGACGSHFHWMPKGAGMKNSTPGVLLHLLAPGGTGHLVLSCSGRRQPSWKARRQGWKPSVMISLSSRWHCPAVLKEAINLSPPPPPQFLPICNNVQFCSLAEVLEDQWMIKTDCFHSGARLKFIVQGLAISADLARRYVKLWVTANCDKASLVWTNIH